MAVLTKTDSEVSSLSQSSPPYSPRRPIYYVQSSSRDSSHDGEKTTNSFHSSPLQSPLGSPPHSHSNSSLGRHSRESASTRFSGSRKSSSTNRKGLWRPWKDHFHAIKEEGLLDAHDNAHHGFPRRCYFLAFILAFLLLFSSFSLILWAASRPQKPAISLKFACDRLMAAMSEFDTGGSSSPPPPPPWSGGEAGTKAGVQWKKKKRFGGCVRLRKDLGFFKPYEAILPRLIRNRGILSYYMPRLAIDPKQKDARTPRGHQGDGGSVA
ncbi:uncharacterized protein LOC114184431 [Vigna unguiculata]|uniref:uncharacterized protein LOC114184431 n=1 Tax=Vigna unguiculata TaxID=3917 RepID=UPI001016BBE6|nr:uncharacterized protein LOC114184431 [Vigna unguiculata]